MAGIHPRVEYRSHLIEPESILGGICYLGDLVKGPDGSKVAEPGTGIGTPGVSQ